MTADNSVAPPFPDGLGLPKRWSSLASRVLAPNPGPMTLEGTNTYVLRSRSSVSSSSGGVVVVDPGPPHPAHLRALLRCGEVEMILLTHHHLDHSEGARLLSVLTGAPVRAAAASLCVNGEALRDGEWIEAGGVRIEVIATPGHSHDSVCFLLPDDASLDAEVALGSVLTGDTILGRGTSVIASPDGSVREYLDSLRRLIRCGPALVLPGHGPRRQAVAASASHYLKHRLQRLDEIRRAADILVRKPADKLSVGAVTDLVYPDVAPAVRFAAEMTVAAHLDYLAEQPRPGCSP